MGNRTKSQTQPDTMENLHAAIKTEMTKSILMMYLVMSVHYSPCAPHALEEKKGTLIAICSNAPCHKSSSDCWLPRWLGVIAVLLIADGLEHKVTG